MPTLREKLDAFVDEVAQQGGASFLSTPDESIDTAEYFYMGWLDVGGSWLVRRIERSSSQSANAIASNNPEHTTLDAAWAARITLVYV